MLEFRILGPLEVVDQDDPVVLGGPRQRALLAVLLLRRGEVVSSDRLIDDVWGEHPPATAAKTLQGYVSHLRKALGDGVLITRAGGYVLEPDYVDADAFDALIAEARAAGDPARARELLGEALALWRGEPLADLAYEPFAQGHVAHLQEARLAALEDRIDADLALGRQRALVGELEALSREHPNRERLLAQLMLALYRSGRQSDALEAYRRGRDALDEQLGLEPGPDLRALEQRILIHDPTLEPQASGLQAVTRLRRGPRLVAAGGALLLCSAVAAGVVALARDDGVGLVASPNSLAAIDTHSNRVVGQVPVGVRPGAIAYEASSLWVANRDDRTVARVDPRTLTTLRTLPVSDPPTGIAAAGGRVWIVGSSAPNPYVTVRRVDPQFDAVRRTARLGNVVSGGPGTVAAGGGALWVAPSAGLLTRLDTATGRAVERVDPNAGPAGIGLDRTGAVWVTDSEAGTVTHVDPTGLTTPIAVGHGPSAIAIGDGAVWVTDTGDDRVVRIDADTRTVTATIAVGHTPRGITLGAGSVWVANSADGTVTRIDAATAKAVATITVGGSPQQIIVVGDRAWVTVDAPLPPAASAETGGTARVLELDDVDSLDPARAYELGSWQLLHATCAKLLNYPDTAGAAGSRLVPEVAQALPERSRDGRTYTYTIRPGFRFSPPDNTTVTAQTFKDAIERTLSPVMRSPIAGQFQDIVGARAYMDGRAAHIAGITTRSNTLTVRLVAPAPDLPARLAGPAFCAVPSNTPVDPNGVRVIPSAGPYRVASYVPGQGIVLTRNPNYHGRRPHHLARIEVAVGVPARRAVAQVEAGRADYATNGEVDAADDRRLAARYGARSSAARQGRQQYFVTAGSNLDFFALNTHRPLFKDEQLRRALSYAIDRRALARVGNGASALPEQPTDHYLPPGMPGYRSDVHVYPLSPDLDTARRLAAGRRRGATAVLYTCARGPCLRAAQILERALMGIGLRLDVKTFPTTTLYSKLLTAGEPYDIAEAGWTADYPDPAAILNTILEGGVAGETFDDPRWRARLAGAARLTGAQRYLTYARLDTELARDAAPLIAWGNYSTHELLSARMGCVSYGVYGLDLAALCIRR